MGARVLCVHGWPRRAGDSGIHPESGARRSTARSTALVVMEACHQRWYKKPGRVSATEQLH